MREYQRLETREGGVECDTSQSECYSRARPLQGLHLVAFIASLLFCLAVIVSFLWVLPCDLATCSSSTYPSPTIPWDKTYSGVEVYGGLHVVGGYVVMLERAPLWGVSSIDPDPGRLLALTLSSGEVAWYSRLPSNTSSLACPPDQPPLCFTLSKPNTLFAVDPTTGVIAWRFPQKAESEMEPPLVIPDANQDSHSDLALLVKTKEGVVSVLVISGGDGKVVTNEITNCTSAANLTFEKTLAKLQFDCTLSSGVVVSKLVPIPGVMKAKVRVRAAGGRPRTPSSHSLMIQYRNAGTCPDDCTVNVTISSSSDGSLAWHYNETAAYLMQPIPIKFKPNLSGFLLKLWHWNLQSKETGRDGEEGKGGLRLESITERIVLITLDRKMSAQVVNASETEITRLCTKPTSTHESHHCQPSIHSNTALITDVNGDHSQDLISYYVTYRPDRGVTDSNGNRFPWILDSKIRVVRLEAELPKLYQLVSPHQ